MKSASAPFNMLLLAGVALVAFLLLGPILTIPLHILLNYNEGWNAYFASRAVPCGFRQVRFIQARTAWSSTTIRRFPSIWSAPWADMSSAT